MLCVETIGKIRRRRLVHGESISAIARDLGLSRNTVKRALRFEGEAYEYRRVHQPMPKLGPFLATLDGWLEVEQTLPAREPRTRGSHLIRRSSCRLLASSEVVSRSG